MKKYIPSVRDVHGLKRAPVLADAELSGQWVPPTTVYRSDEVDKEREFTDAVINAIGEISVAECQAAIAKWRAEH